MPNDSPSSGLSRWRLGVAPIEERKLLVLDSFLASIEEPEA